MRNKTIAVILFAVAALIGWDFYAMFVGGVDSTISSVIIDSAYSYPVIPFAFGFLMGHFFWKISKKSG